MAAANPEQSEDNPCVIHESAKPKRRIRKCFVSSYVAMSEDRKRHLRKYILDEFLVILAGEKNCANKYPVSHSGKVLTEYDL